MMRKISIAMLSAAILLTAGIAAGGYLVNKIEDRVPKRPAICDRTGKTLLSDVRRSVFAVPVRHAECGGKAALLGHTIDRNGKRIGAGGVEHLIDRGATTDDRLFLTLDAGIQKKCEKLLDNIAATAAPEYAYITILDPDGALIAAAQRPVIDLNDRRKVAPRETVFMASAYVFPVSDAWMRLLGSRSDAPPEEKLRLGFHRKLGIFPGEGKGAIPGAEQRHYVKNNAQSATALNFLLACAGVMGKRAIPDLKIFLPDASPPFGAEGQRQGVVAFPVVVERPLDLFGMGNDPRGRYGAVYLGAYGICKNRTGRCQNRRHPAGKDDPEFPCRGKRGHP